jgi:DNA-binding NtrC family response regulator
LRERREDLESLAQTLMARLVRRRRLPLKKLSEAGRRRLLGYAWPGNLRELSHELERALVFADSAEIQLEQLLGAGGQVGGSTVAETTAAPSAQEWFNPAFHFPDSEFQLEQAFLRLVQHALSQSAGNVSGAARLLGVTRDYIRYRLAEAPATRPDPMPPKAGP